jgi:transcriptional regulator with XRE-family HTH domain|tara:strand:+ start:426 stop:560 length:135 start_codon:yes stop_codon:yes gene_type:complete
MIGEKLTQNKLCKQLGIGVSTLSRWLNGLTAKMNPAYLARMDEM